MRKVSRIAISCLGIILFSSWVAAQTATPGNPKNGEAIYTKNCLRCHGESLEGNGPEARYLIVPPANLQSVRSRSKTDFQLLIVISHGVIFSPMHA